MVTKGSFRANVSAGRWLVLVVAVLTMTGTAAAMGKVALKSSETVDRTIPVGVLKRVNVSNTDGNIVVTGDPAARDITLSAVKSVWGRTPKKLRQAQALLGISVESRGDLLAIRPTCPEFWKQTYQVEFFLTVPSSFRVEISTVSGAVQVRNVREVDVSATTGDVLLSQVKTITVKGNKGDVEVEPTSGPVDVTTVSGVVRASLVGNVQSVRVLTTSGDVSLQVPEDLGAELGITTTSGLVTTEGLTLRNARQTRFGLRATVNRGGIPIEVTSTSGRVTVTTEPLPPATVRPLREPERRAAPPVITEPMAPAVPQAPAVLETPAAPDTVGKAVPTEEAAPDTSGVPKDTGEAEPPGAAE